MIRQTISEMLKSSFPNITFPPNKYIDLIEPEGHISDKLYFNNLTNENELYEILNRTNNIFKHTPRYCQFDYIAETEVLKGRDRRAENANIFIELKSRNVRINQYKSTIFPINKVDYYRKLKGLNRDVNNVLILVFSFIDDNANNKYYYIQYNKELFASYKKMKLPNGEYFNILIRDLKPLERLKLIN